MKITETKNCIETMRECYKFDDDKTEIRLGDLRDMGNGHCVSVFTKDENGTSIQMSKYANEMFESE